ncbi:3-deoxy-8-phosphooctulonate synthase [Desulfovibrio sp. OttesenSCG-928-F20]|nr:3-deoxy-8-phosphooctulonate synthase [Desulfovibrio sp. OttesenSCG-928-M16]MDL2290601.1 3-deoxy-8-phosphooctulonate synthase [Desulfovibrio sp. OttesenSCG-928-F20]
MSTFCFDSQALYQRLCSAHFVIAGPCVLESFELARDTAVAVKSAAEKAGLTAVFKSSYAKANRSSAASFAGPGLAKGLEWLARIRQEVALPVITDIHDPAEAALAAQAVDILQIPAFLCRQTQLLQAAGESGRIVNIKKGQFMAPWDMRNVYDKVAATGNNKILLTERGSCFGYNNLVVDMRSFAMMADLGVPLVMDATHSVQLPGAGGACSGGDRRMAPHLARAAVGAGAHAVFLECHPNPDEALCDGPNSLDLADLPGLLQQLSAMWSLLDAH